MLKALLIDWQRETQNDWTKTRDRGLDLLILRLLTERQLPAACVRQFCPVVFSQYSPEGKVLNRVLHGEAPLRGLNPYPLPFFPLTIDYPTHPCHILQLVNSLSFDTDPKPEKGTPFVRSLPV